MCVDAHVSCCARQRFALSVGDVLLGLGVAVLLGHAEVDDVDDVGRLGARAADEEVVGLDVAVDEVLLVDCLYAGQHLLGDHDDRLDGEAAVAVVEQVFQRRSEQVDDEDVVQTLLAEVVDIGDAGWRGVCQWAGRIGELHSNHSRQPTRILYVLYSSRN